MTRIEAIKEDLRLGKRIKAVQEADERVAYSQWEQAVKRREATEARLGALLRELWELQGQAPMAGRPAVI